MKPDAEHGCDVDAGDVEAQRVLLGVGPKRRSPIP
jgi:hypothetical protein